MGQMRPAEAWHLAHGASQGLGDLVAGEQWLLILPLACCQIPKRHTAGLGPGCALSPHTTKSGMGQTPLSSMWLCWGWAAPPLTHRARLCCLSLHSWIRAKSWPFPAELGQLPFPHAAGLGLACPPTLSAWCNGDPLGAGLGPLVSSGSWTN